MRGNVVAREPFPVALLPGSRVSEIEAMLRLIEALGGTVTGNGLRD